MFTFRDTGREFELKGDLLKMITNKNYKVDLARLSDKKVMYDFAKECILMKEMLVINLFEIESL